LLHSLIVLALRGLDTEDPLEPPTVVADDSFTPPLTAAEPPAGGVDCGAIEFPTALKLLLTPAIPEELACEAVVATTTEVT